MANEVEITVTSKDKTGPGLDSADKRVSKFSGSMGKLSGIAAGAAAGIGIGAIAIGKRMYDVGNRMDALDEKSKIVFEDRLGSVQAWAAGNTKAFGATEREIVGMAANLADLLKPMGFTAEQAATMSTKMVDLSGALSKWTGGTKSAAEVSEILSDAMLGETDGLKALGISISAAEIDAKLLAKGQDKLTGSARQQAEALATQELIMAKSTDAQKAWANGGKAAAEAQNSTKASIGSLTESLSTMLQPALDKAVSILNTLAAWAAENPKKLQAIAAVIGGVLVVAFTAWAISAASAAVATIAATWPILLIIAAIAALVVGIILLVKNWDKVKAKTIEVAKAIGTWIWNAVKSVGNALWSMLKFVASVPGRIARLLGSMWSTITSAFGSMWTALGGGVGRFFGWVAGWPSAVYNRLASMWSTIVSAFGSAWTTLSGGVSRFLGWVAGWPTAISNRVGGMFDGIKNAFKAAINWIIGKWNNLSFTIPGVDTHIPGVGTVGGFTLNTPDLPYLQRGGRAVRGGLAVVGEHGAEVVRLPTGASVYPTDRVGGGPSVTFIVQPGGSGLDRLFVTWLQKAVRVRGGNVQTVLGSGAA